MSLSTMGSGEIAPQGYPGRDPRLAQQNVPVGKAVNVLRRRKWLVMLIIGLVSAPSAALIFHLPRYYDAETELEVDTSKTEFSDLQVSADAVSGDTLTIRTQTDILTSRQMAGKVADQLGLVRSPEVQALLHPHPSAVARAIGLAERTLAMAPPPAKPLTADEQRQVAVGWLLGHTSVTNDGRSYTIVVRARTPDPILSARIANVYASTYLEFMRQLKVNALTRAHSWLDEQLHPLKQRVLAAERAVETFREQHGLVLERPGDGEAGGPGGSTVADQQMTEVDTALTAARTKLAQAQSSLAQVNEAIRTGTGFDAIPEVVQAPLVQRLGEQLATLESQQAALAATDDAQNPRLLALDASVAGVQRRIRAETAKVAASLRGDADVAQAQVTQLEGNLGSLQGKVTGENMSEVTLRQLTSEAEATRTVYKDYLDRYEQTSAQAAMQEPDVNLISIAYAPLGPTGPARGQLMVLALVGSTILGVVAALGVERLRVGVRTAEELEGETGLFPLGFVPRAHGRDRSGLEMRETEYTAAVDHVRGMLRFGDAMYRAHVALVTSAVPGEGKTFFCVSLAASVGRGGGRALIIDADVRRSQVAVSIDPWRPEAGRLDMKAGAISIRRDMMPGVDVMTMRPQTGSQLPARLDPPDLERVINEARQHYDLILIDTPPVLALPDAPSFAGLVDGALLVVRWRHTPIASVTAALRTLQAYRMRVIGSVVTQVQLDELAGNEGGHVHLYKRSSAYFGA